MSRIGKKPVPVFEFSSVIIDDITGYQNKLGLLLIDLEGNFSLLRSACTAIAKCGKTCGRFFSAGFKLIFVNNVSVYQYLVPVGLISFQSRKVDPVEQGCFVEQGKFGNGWFCLNRF